MKTLMTKECPICGGYFETTNNLRKYCDDCSAHTQAREREYDKAYKESYYRMYEPELIHGTCSECGKDFDIPKKFKELLKNNLYFCGLTI